MEYHQGQDFDRVVTPPLSSCFAPLENGVAASKVTLQRFLQSGPVMNVRVHLSRDAFCSSLALTMMVEMGCNQAVRLQECSLQTEVQQPVDNHYCLYQCVCAGPCSRFHLQFQSVEVIAINNTAWKYCGVELCEP